MHLNNKKNKCVIGYFKRQLSTFLDIFIVGIWQGKPCCKTVKQHSINFQTIKECLWWSIWQAPCPESCKGAHLIWWSCWHSMWLHTQGYSRDDDAVGTLPVDFWTQSLANLVSYSLNRWFPHKQSVCTYYLVWGYIRVPLSSELGS